MSTNGIHIIDRTINDTNLWLNHIQDSGAAQNKQEAYHALRSVLQALRDRLTIELTASLSAQLPVLIRGLFFEGFTPAIQPLDYRSITEWRAAVRAIAGIDFSDERIDEATTAVFAATQEHLDSDLTEKIFTMLPKPVRDLWVGIEEEVAHNA